MQRRKTIMITGLCLGLSLMLAACQTKIPEPTDSPAQTESSRPFETVPAVPPQLPPTEEQKNALMDKLIAASGGEIVQFLCLDYDGNGDYEAFAIVGSKEEQSVDTYNGTLWFVTDANAVSLGDSSSYSYIERITAGQQYLMTVSKNLSAASLSYVYGVKDGQAYEEPVSGKLTGLKQNADGTFTAVQDAYDACTDGTGHTWKPYWYYWEDGLHEFGGIEMTEQEFAGYDGAEKALDLIRQQNGQIKNILYRSNGIININYLTPWSRDGVDDYINHNFLNLRWKDESVTVLESEDNRGNYVEALTPELATFPEQIPKS